MVQRQAQRIAPQLLCCMPCDACGPSQSVCVMSLCRCRSHLLAHEGLPRSEELARWARIADGAQDAAEHAAVELALRFLMGRGHNRCVPVPPGGVPAGVRRAAELEGAGALGRGADAAQRGARRGGARGGRAAPRRALHGHRARRPQRALDSAPRAEPGAGGAEHLQVQGDAG